MQPARDSKDFFSWRGSLNDRVNSVACDRETKWVYKPLCLFHRIIRVVFISDGCTPRVSCFFIVAVRINKAFGKSDGCDPVSVGNDGLNIADDLLFVFKKVLKGFLILKVG